MVRLFRHDDGLLPNLSAMGYAFVGYVAGLWMLLHSTWWLNAAGVLLLGHAMVIAAYLLHECAHNTLFSKNRHHAWLGEALMWIVGASYGRYEDIRHKHVRHHTDRADVVAFDFRPWLSRHPLVLRSLQALEWCYVPAVDMLMHALVLVLPFTLSGRRDRRRRVVVVVLLRLAFFASLAWFSPRVLMLYPLSYLLMLHMLRFMDVHQHTYSVLESLEMPRGAEAKRHDRAFEQANTFSNLISQRHPWLNLLVLNFAYHNAHHQQPGMPWYRLPRLHDQFLDLNNSQVLPFSRLLSSYHRYRVKRIINGDPPGLDVRGDKASAFVGVVGVSFLTAH
ncbi:MAG: fatty acid desaturase [Gammaproteobacteria bacterium]|nr:fatty acid desaturase [Gammaproteobacteria bacterium]